MHQPARIARFQSVFRIGIDKGGKQTLFNLKKEFELGENEHALKRQGA
jgi:hypothetical protein